MVLSLKVYWKAYLALFRPLDLEKKKAQTRQYSSRENYYKLTSGGSSAELKFWSIGVELNQQSNKFVFSTVYNEFQSRFQEKKTRFPG